MRGAVSDACVTLEHDRGARLTGIPEAPISGELQ